MKLINPSDDQLNEAFAENVAGMAHGQWQALKNQDSDSKSGWIGPGYNLLRAHGVEVIGKSDSSQS